jgi:hypothetical protein
VAKLIAWLREELNRQLGVALAFWRVAIRHYQSTGS